MVLIGEDIFRDDKRELSFELDEQNKTLFVAVADGMGGHNAGEVASEIVLRKIGERIKTLEEGLTEKELREKISQWVKEIHYYIIEEGNKEIGKKGMGSTLIGALFYGEAAYYINVGDSRLYRFRRGNLLKISRDHSLREMTGNENIASNLIINSFGGGENIFVDFLPIGGKLLTEDILILCSDGLSDMLSDNDIESLLDKGNGIDKLLFEAKNKGGNDNISIVLICIDEI